MGGISPVPYQRPPVELYNPTDFTRHVQFHGRIFRAPPQSAFKVYDILDYARNERQELLVNAPKLVPGGGTLTAEYIAAWICQSDQSPHKRDHFVILNGTAAEKEDLKRQARARWEKVYVGEVQSRILQWERFISSRPAGEPIPQQPREIILAYEWRRLHRQHLAERKQFVCRVCAYETDSWENVREHVGLEHEGVSVEQAVANMKSPDLPDTAEAKAPEQSPAGLGLIEAADAIGLPLTVADRKGCTFGDEDVIADVRGRLRAHRSAEQAAGQSEARVEARAAAEAAEAAAGRDATAADEGTGGVQAQEGITTEDDEREAAEGRSRRGRGRQRTSA